MSNAQLGQKIEADAKKDAIHVAIAPVIATENLSRGDYLKFAYDGDTQSVTKANKNEAIGIVDPFLTQRIKVNERFYMALFPGTVTGMRHEWEHPAFTANNFDESKEYVRRVAETCGLTYERMIAVCEEYVDSPAKYGGLTNMGVNEDYKDVEDWQTFWEHFSKVTGKPIPEYASFPFTCAC